MNNIFKTLAIGAVAAAAMFETGCSKAGKYDSPRVPDGAIVAAAVDKDNLFARLETVFGKDKFDAMKSDFKLGAGKDFYEFLNDAGIEEKDIKWGFVASKMPEFDEIYGFPQKADFSVVIRVDHDTDKLYAAFKKLESEHGSSSEKLCEEDIAGVKALVVRPVSREEEIIPTFVSLEGKLVIFAPTTGFGATMVELYRDGKGASAKFGDFELDSDDILVAKIVDFGENISKTPFAKGLAEFNQVLPNGEAIVKGVKDVNVKVESVAGGKQGKATVVAAMASAEDASLVKSVIEVKIAEMKSMFKMMAEQNPAMNEEPEAKMMLSIVNGIKVEAEGANLKVSLEGEADAVSIFAQGAMSAM